MPTSRPHTDVRDHLRGATAPAHARVDAAFSRFDLHCRDGRAAFLSAQAAGLRSALLALRSEPLWARTVEARIAAALRDADRPDLPSIDLSAHDALGVAYVVAGSLHGTGILRTRLRRAGVRPLPAFFESDGWRPMWRDVLARLETAETSRIPALVSAADAAFAAFGDAALRVREREAA